LLTYLLLLPRNAMLRDGPVFVRPSLCVEFVLTVDRRSIGRFFYPFPVSGE